MLDVGIVRTHADEEEGTGDHPKPSRNRHAADRLEVCLWPPPRGCAKAVGAVDRDCDRFTLVTSCTDVTARSQWRRARKATGELRTNSHRPRPRSG